MGNTDSTPAETDPHANERRLISESGCGDGLEMVHHLLDKGVSVNCSDGSASPLWQACRFGPTEIVDVLWRRGAKLEFVGRNGLTPLHAAVDARRGARLIQKLITAKADPACANDEGFTVLMDAVHNYGRDVVESLLLAKANVNVANNKGDVALHMAARRGALDVVKLLVKHHADLSARNAAGDSPEQSCANEQVRSYLQQAVAAASTARTRRALIIGNNYPEQGDKALQSCLNDARKMKEVLESDCGFREITLLENVTNQEMLIGLLQFRLSLKDGDIALFYFSGHGMVFDGVMFLQPCGAGYFSMHDVQEHLFEGAGAGGIKLFIVDACRCRISEIIKTKPGDPSKAPQPSETKTAAPSALKGKEFASIQSLPKSANSCIMYATAEATPAFAGGTNDLSLYTKALVGRMATPNLELRQLSMHVRQSLMNSGTIPHEDIAMLEHFYFVPKDSHGGVGDDKQSGTATTATLTSETAAKTEPSGSSVLDLSFLEWDCSSVQATPGQNKHLKADGHRLKSLNGSHGWARTAKPLPRSSVSTFDLTLSEWVPGACQFLGLGTKASGSGRHSALCSCGGGSAHSFGIEPSKYSVECLRDGQTITLPSLVSAKIELREGDVLTVRVDPVQGGMTMRRGTELVCLVPLELGLDYFVVAQIGESNAVTLSL